MNKPLIIATRKSKLALAQAEAVKFKIEQAFPTMAVTLFTLSTTGDENTTTSLAAIGGKGLFVKTLQQALLDERAHIAVHSVKDMSAHPHPTLQLAAMTKREDPRDAFISNEYTSLADLPQGAIVGTSSPRRECQIKAFRSDLQVKLLRGNVESRLKKLDNGDFDAIILASAGLNRLHLNHRITEHLDADHFIPAIGQGAVGIECRSDKPELIALLSFLNDAETQTCVSAERVVNQQLKGDCHTPIGAHAILTTENTLQLTAMVGSLDGKTILRSRHEGKIEEAQKIAEHVAEDLLSQGAGNFL